MNRLNWIIARQFDRLPLLTMLAWLSVILLVLIMVWFFMLFATTPSSDNSQRQPVGDTTVITPAPLSSVNDVLSSAPQVKQVTDVIETMFRLASKHQINLEEVVYQNQDDTTLPLIRYSIDFSVEQSYPRIKVFITDLLQQLPYLALDQVSFEREEIQSRRIHSRLRFILFMGKDHE